MSSESCLVGVAKSKRLRGRALSSSATASSWASVTVEKSNPFGKYCLSTSWAGAHPRGMKMGMGVEGRRRRGVRRRACSGRSVALSMTWELRYPDLCFEHAEQTLDPQAPLHGVAVGKQEVGRDGA